MAMVVEVEALVVLALVGLMVLVALVSQTT
jgi:hypothetical protein